MDESVPPLEQACKSLLLDAGGPIQGHQEESSYGCELPVIDLSSADCSDDIAEASRQWGFFQVVNHGVPPGVLETMLAEQRRVFRQPFAKKASGNVFVTSSDRCYRWGNPTAITLRQMPWYEAFHIPVADISSGMREYKNFRLACEEFATKAGHLAQIIAKVLVEKLGVETNKFFEDNFSPCTSYLRISRYPPCPIPNDVFAFLPHTDSDFLTILYQDQVGGLQLFRDGHWFTIIPNPMALIINIGDLFQAWSNGVYKSVEHRVLANEVERLSAAYFYCPFHHTTIRCCSHPQVYRDFTFKDYIDQIRADVHRHGNKVGLSRFLRTP